ncbi:MauE/DoxX family redox-associated membrane protein [Pseudoflavitalea rhizosphaerae]|uniref:MauE/DoxX family redox-associated membrane protein n=1 Tax=Pseudoflavitalea rhizosphaerae TaxID=1884793 RepID=UPI001F498E06|nr:MauE/DoxX family redox-associated membrane protein [Pseudoflavitalea rhizosphaerae]
MSHNLTYNLAWKKAIIYSSIFLLVSLFIYAAYNKLAIYSTFVEQLNESPITKNYRNILAWLVPGTEILLAIALLVPKTRLLGFYGSFFLMLLFTIYVFVVPHFYSTRIPCSCGGIISSFSWKGHFYFNLAFTLLAAIGLVLHSHQLQTDNAVMKKIAQ